MSRPRQPATAPPGADDEAVWRALADRSRRRILDLLRERPRTTGELASCFEFSRYAVMKHLKVLHAAGLLLVERHGRERFNHLNPLPLQRIVRRWVQPFEARAADRLLRLEEHVHLTPRPGAPTSGEDD
jgi:DNA-binding transcriptional ArsR family regulator